MTLDFLWYLVVLISMISYAVLDGFDLGVGTLHLLTKKDQDRRVFLNAIGPVWDGNEVWLVIVVGTLFAGFPPAYATLLSSFYDLIMIFLTGLMFRAVAIEFRSKLQGGRWRKIWDAVFSMASLIIAFGVGLVLGNLIEGIPLDRAGDFQGTTSDLIRPYSLLVGLTTVALFTMHGAIFLVMKTEGALHERLRRWVKKAILAFIFCYLATTAATFWKMPHMTEIFFSYPELLLIPVLALGAISLTPWLMQKKQDGWAFLTSCFSIALLLSLFAIGTYPYLIRSSIDPENNSLSILNSASSPLTLTVLLIIVAIGVPLVLAYGFYIYRVFRGKVRLSSVSY